MKTAALLPTPGDPYQVAYWLRNYDRVWRGEVNELRVLVNGQPDEPSRDAIRREVERVGGIYDEREGPTPHGTALNILIQDTDADVVILCEDDAYVRSRGAVRVNLELLANESFTIIGSPRESMSPELSLAAVERWGSMPEARDGAQGSGLWPALLFAKRSALLATDRGYGERAWGRGMTVPGVGHVVTGDTVVADTFGGTALQLREKFNITVSPQFKGPWRWEEWLDAGTDIPWFHVGSLSSSGNLVVEEPVFADGRTLTDEMELGEWSHRLYWWGRFHKTCKDILPLCSLRYSDNLTRLRERMGVSHERISAWDDVCNRMVNWDES